MLWYVSFDTQEGWKRPGPYFLCPIVVFIVFIHNTLYTIYYVLYTICYMLYTYTYTWQLYYLYLITYKYQK